MRLSQRFVQGHQMKLIYDIIGQCFRQRHVQTSKHRGRETFQRARVHALALHLLRHRIVGLHAQRGQGKAIRHVQVRMCDVDFPAVSRRPAKHNVFRVQLITGGHILDALKPDQIYHTVPIGKMRHQPTFPPFSFCFKTENLPLELHIRHVCRQLMYIIQTGAVYVFIRKIVQQIVQGGHVQFVFQEFGSLRPHSGQISNVLLQDIIHTLIQTSRSKPPQSFGRTVWLF